MTKGQKIWDEMRGVIYLIAFLGAVYFVVAYLFPDDWRIKWCFRYVVAFDNVTIEHRPTLCDWGHAPLGKKGCHYESVIVRKSINLSTEGKPIVSYDAGKTWKKPPFDFSASELAELRLDRQRAEFVHVRWEKKEDP